MNKKTNPGLKIICLNRKASFNYFFEDLLEAGIVLKGSEIKSIRNCKINIADSYAIEKSGEIFLINSHIKSFKIITCFHLKYYLIEKHIVYFKYYLIATFNSIIDILA